MAEPVIELMVVDGRPTVRGECDLSNADEIEAWLGEYDDEPLEVDLSGVTFFDSSALGAFLRVRRRNPKLRIVNPSHFVLRVLEITATADYLIDDRDGFI